MSIIASGPLGRSYNRGLVYDFEELLKTKYDQKDDKAGHSTDGYDPNDKAVSAGYMPIAQESKLTKKQIETYIKRGSVLKSAANISDSSVLLSGFKFDIKDTLNNLNYNSTTIFPGIEGSGKIQEIPQDIITAKPYRAFISAALIECLIYLSSDDAGNALKIIGGFGSHRGSTYEDQGTNLGDLESGGTVTDHAFGRAFDFSSISKVDEKLKPINSGAEALRSHLDNLLEKLNTAPQHILPDFIMVNNSVGSEYKNGYADGKINKISQKYQNLKYVKIHLVADSHADHIHISFSPQRGGFYNESRKLG